MARQNSDNDRRDGVASVLSDRNVTSLGRTNLGATCAGAPSQRHSAVDVNAYGELVGVSPPMRQLFGVLGRLEGSLMDVLVEGDSGTGKGLAAAAIHARSPVSKGPFVAANCGAIDPRLVRRELFG